MPSLALTVSLQTHASWKTCRQEGEDFNPVLKSLLHARFPFTLKAKDANAYFNEAFPGASDHDIPAKSVFEALSKAMRICFEEYVQPTPKALRTTATNLGLSRPQSFTPLDISRAFKEWADTHGLPQRLGVKIRDGQPTIWILSPSDQHNPLKSNLVWILQHRTNTDPDRPEQPHVYQYSAAQAAAQATAPIPPIDGATRRTLSNGGGHTDSDSECAEESPAESSRSSRSSSSSSSSSEEKKREKSKRRRRMLIMRRLSTVAAEWYKRMRGEGDNRVGPLELR